MANINTSVLSTIEKIKIQEQDTENKLKEKREYESSIITLNRAVKDALQHTEKYQQEQELLEKKVDNLRMELVMDKTRNEALLAQVEACYKELKELNYQSDQDVMRVWETRSSLCTSVQDVADNCDIRALLIKPIHSESITPPAKDSDENTNQLTETNESLKRATERRNKAINERNRLQAEPDEGEEFLR